MEFHLPPSEQFTQWTPRIFLSAATLFVSIALLMTLLVRAFPNALDGDVVSGARHENTFRNVTEIFYFLSNLVLLLVTITLSIFARRQLIATRRAAQADVYINIAATVLSAAFLEQSAIAHNLLNEYESLPANAGMTKVDFINDKFQSSTFKADGAKLISLLAYVEHIAILIRRRHLPMDDAFFLLEGQLTELRVLLLDSSSPWRSSSQGCGNTRSGSCQELKTTCPPNPCCPDQRATGKGAASPVAWEVGRQRAWSGCTPRRGSPDDRSSSLFSPFHSASRRIRAEFYMIRATSWHRRYWLECRCRVVNLAA